MPKQDKDAQYIIEHIAKGDDCRKQGVEHYLAAGERLLAVKQRVGHGKFQPWVKRWLKVSHRQAQKYLRLAKSAQKGAFGDDSKRLECEWLQICGYRRESSSNDQGVKARVKKPAPRQQPIRQRVTHVDRDFASPSATIPNEPSHISSRTKANGKCGHTRPKVIVGRSRSVQDTSTLIYEEQKKRERLAFCKWISKRLAQCKAAPDRPDRATAQNAAREAQMTLESLAENTHREEALLTVLQWLLAELD